MVFLVFFKHDFALSNYKHWYFKLNKLYICKIWKKKEKKEKRMKMHWKIQGTIKTNIGNNFRQKFKVPEIYSFKRLSYFN